ncbi:hypothetical protein H8959_022317 [Pygathrix nigripes]
MRRGSSSAREESFSHQGKAAASTTVSVQVTDANDPPTFHPQSFIVSKNEGAGPGTLLGTFNAMDPDSQIRYKLVHDPANWVSVDENSGVVTTVEPIDRESPHVNDSFYIIIVHAVDDGFPPQTATGTLMLFLSDINDNALTLRPHSRYVEVCESAVHQPLHVEAEDPDLEPFSDPFTFELDNTQGNTEDIWKLGKNWGQSVELLTLRSLPRGNYLVPLFTGDKQGLSQKQTVRRHGCSISNDEGYQTLVMYNEESKATSAQTWSDVEGQRPALLVCIAAAGPKQGAKWGKLKPPPSRFWCISGFPSVSCEYSNPPCHMVRQRPQSLNKQTQLMDQMCRNSMLPTCWKMTPATYLTSTARRGSVEGPHPSALWPAWNTNCRLICWTLWVQRRLCLRKYIQSQVVLPKKMYILEN